MVDLLLAGRLVSLVSGLALLWLAARSLVGRETPAAGSFGALLAVLGVAALCGAATAHSGTPYKLVWLVTTLAIPLVLAAFSFDYYGLGYFGTRSRFAAATVPVVLGVLGGGAVILGTPANSPGDIAPVPALAGLPDAVFELAGVFNDIGLYYATGLVILAVALVLRTVVRYEHLDGRLGPTVAFVGVWPWLAYSAMPELAGVVGREPLLLGVAGGYVGSALAAALAVGPLGLFESTPAAGNVGPETVLDSIEDAVLVVDDADHLVRVNDVARDTFGIVDRDHLGGPLPAALDCSLADLPDGETVALDTVSGPRRFAVTRSPLTDRTGGSRGSAVVLRDVTRRQTREQRLAVLNRVLRHNLRNDAASIIGRAELIGDGGDPDQAERIVDTTEELVDVAERARDIESMMDAPRGERTARVGPVVERVVGAVADDNPGVETTTAVPEDATAAVSPEVLETVLANLVENAAEHNDADQPLVVVSADRTDEGLAVAVADNGPGIPDHERSVLAGTESQLDHASGLGLWAVNWGVTRMGGRLSFSENEPRGSVVTVTLPTETASPAEPAGVV
jgi:signal transduction histidine kinase